MSARDDYPMYDGDSYEPAMDEIDRLRTENAHLQARCQKLLNDRSFLLHQIDASGW